MASVGGARLKYEPGLDGLRGIAVLAMLAYHAEFSRAQGAFLSLSAFFTLSGFLITSLLLLEREREGRIDLRNFWSRRFRRLLPAALLTIAGLLLFAVTVADADQLNRLRGDLFAALAYVANWHFIFGGQDYAAIFSEPSPVQHFWSLAVEEQFYLVFPLLIGFVLWGTRGSRRSLFTALLVAAVGSAVLMAVLVEPGSDRAYYGTDTRAAEFLVGALLAVVVAGREPVAGRWSRRVVAAVGLLAVAGTVALWVNADLHDPGLYPWGFVGAAVLTATLIVATTTDGPVKRMFSARPIVWVGVLSYGIYLFHWPVFLWLDEHRTGLPAIPLFAVRLAVCVALAAVSYHLVERPIRRGERLGGRQALVAAPVAVSALVAGILLVTASPPSPPLDFAAEAGAVEDVPTPTTVPGDQRTRILVVGDSVSYNLAEGLQRVADPNETILWNQAVPGCTLGRGGQKRVAYGEGETGEICDHWSERWTEALIAFSPDVVLTTGSIWDVTDRLVPELGDEWRSFGDPVYDEWFRSELDEAMGLLTSRGARLVWAVQPHVARDASVPENDPARVDRLNELVVEVAAEHPGVSLVDLAGWVDQQGWDDPGLRHDGIHYTDAGADAAAAFLLGQAL